MKVFWFLILLLIALSSCSQVSETTNNIVDEGLIKKDFLASLEWCEIYNDTYEHPYGFWKMERKILWWNEDNCNYTEELPNNGLMSCAYSRSNLKKVVAYYTLSLSAEGGSFESNVDILWEWDTKTSIVVDGEVIDTSYMTIMMNNFCKISWY